MINADNRILGYGVAGSLAMHVLLFCALAIFMGVGRVLQIPRSAPDPEPVVTLVSPQDIQEMPPEEVPKPKTATERYLRTTQDAETTNPPAKPDFISDRNTVASAKLAADPAGVTAMPTLNGVNVVTSELADREHKDGQLGNDSAPPTPPLPKPEALLPQLPPQQKMIESKEHLALDIRRAGDPPELAPEMKTPDEPPGPKPMAAGGSAPSASPPEKDSFTPQTWTGATKGTVGSPGSRDSVNAVSTAAGRYEHHVKLAIEMKWHEILQQKKFLVDPGKLRLQFYVDRNGKVAPKELFIVFNEANAELTEIARRSILEAEISPIPEDLLPTLEQGRFGTEYDAVLLEAKNAPAGQ